MPTFALVGASHIHTPGFSNKLIDRSDIQMKYVWDQVVPIAEKHAAKLDAKVVTDPSQVWADPEIEAVIICAETNLHKDLVLPAVGAGKHIFVEKSRKSSRWA